MLKAEFNVRLDEQGEHLMVVNSSIGLWAHVNREHRRPSPVIRLEFDRDAKKKQPSHVHLHAESVQLGWIHGTAGYELPRSHEIHFPLGGKRFRPTLEDFLLFLDREQLFNNWVDGDWESVIDS